MKIVMRFIPAVFVCVLSAGAAIAPSYVLAGMPVEQMIEGAKTKADHEAIAQYYEDEAKADQAKAEEHKKMSVAYSAMTTGKGGHAAFVAHCNRLATKYNELANENLALAMQHHKFAASLEK